MYLKELLSVCNSSAALKIRLGMVLYDLSQQHALFAHIESITSCSLSGTEITLERQLDLMCTDYKAASAIKTAHSVWNKISPDDKLVVFYWFSVLFRDELKDFSASRRTTFFCSIFFKNFIPVLLEYYDLV
jgi:hypothetical protein